MTITRERHAFESQSLAAISSIRRRGVLFVLAVLPDGTRSLIPAEWTDWRPEQADRTPAVDVGDGDHDLGSLGDLLHLRKVIDALSGRHVESAPRKESGHAIEPCLPRPPDSYPEPLPLGSPSTTAWRELDEARGRGVENLARRTARTAPRPDRRGREAMNERAKIMANHLSRQAIVDLRQSSAARSSNNREVDRSNSMRSPLKPRTRLDR